MATNERRYILPAEATRIRIHSERRGEWSIDAADDDGNFTEECWNRDGAIDRTMTFDRAVERIPEFRDHLGLPAGIPTEVWGAGGRLNASDAMVAKARLIAAAPELLKALSFVLPVLRRAADQTPMRDDEGVNLLLEAHDEVARAIALAGTSN